jgi:SAM-dependent methyltransferase
VIVAPAQLVRPWKLDIGCGRRKEPGHIGLDHSLSSDADVVADVSHGIPFRGGVFEGVWMSHVFEHVAQPVALMEEIWRVGKEGALVEIRGPHFSSPNLVWGDPTHRRGLSLGSFVYFAASSDWYLTKARFEIRKAYLAKGDTEFASFKRKVWYWPLVLWNKVWQRLISVSPSAILRYERLLGRFIAFQELRVLLEVCKGESGKAKTE